MTKDIKELIYTCKNLLFAIQQKDKLNQETYHSVIHKALKRILKLTVSLRKQGILTDPSIDLITSNLFHIYEAGNIQEDIISIELNELLSNIQQPEPLTPLVTEIPIPSAAPLSKVTFNKKTADYSRPQTRMIWSSGRPPASNSLTPSGSTKDWEKKIAEQKRVLEASQSHMIHPEYQSRVRAVNRDNPQSNEDLTVEQVYAPPKSGPPSKRNLKKKSSTKIKPPSPPPIKEPTPPESSSSGEEQPVVPVITPAPVIPSTPPEAPVIPPAPLSPPKFASLAKYMYPMP